MTTWQLQEAKARLSALVKEAYAGKPQKITLHGKPAVVVISSEQYENLIHPQPKLLDFLRQSPLADVKLNIVRNKTPGRDIDL